MLHHLPRVAGLVAIVASLALVPGVTAATASTSSTAAKAKKERAYGKYCGAKRKGSARAAQRTKCLDAMAKLATGRSSSPSKACRGLSKKKVAGERKSAYARCVSEGAKLLKSKRRPAGGTSGADDGDHVEADEDADEAGEEADAGDEADDLAPLDGDDPGDDGAADDDSADPGDGESGS
jgi:hypothetical protein